MKANTDEGIAYNIEDLKKLAQHKAEISNRIKALERQIIAGCVSSSRHDLVSMLHALEAAKTEYTMSGFGSWDSITYDTNCVMSVPNGNIPIAIGAGGGGGSKPPTDNLVGAGGAAMSMGPTVTSVAADGACGHGGAEIKSIPGMEIKFDKDIKTSYYLVSIRVGDVVVKLDPYRIAEIYGIKDMAHAHALKKILRLGKGHKSIDRDIDETIDALKRLKQMREENENDEVEFGNFG